MPETQYTVFPSTRLLQSHGIHNLVIHLFFQSIFWGGSLLCLFSGVFAWAELPHPLSGGGAQCNLVVYMAFFAWWISVPLQRVRAKMTLPGSLAQSWKIEVPLLQ